MESTKLGRLAIKLGKLTSSIGHKLNETNKKPIPAFTGMLTMTAQTLRLCAIAVLIPTAFLLTLIASLYVNIIKKP